MCRAHHQVLGVWLLLVGLVGGCKKDPVHQGSAPPPVDSAAKPGACGGGGGQIADPATAAVFPRQIVGYCIDPNGEARTFGAGSKLPITAICEEAWDGGCEQYKQLGVRRVVQLRYIDGGGSPGSVEIYLSQFATREGAYAMFTQRVVADSDPLDSAPRVLSVAGAGAIGTGRAYVWKDTYLAELAYANEQETPEQMKASSDRIMVPIATEMASRLRGDALLPPAAALLPNDNRIAQGISYAAKDVLGIVGLGPGAVGFYKEGAKRYRVLSIVRDDADQAKDVLKTFGRVKGASEEKNFGDGAYKLTLAGEARTDWIVVRAGKSVLGIGDDEFAVRPGMNAGERERVVLSKDEKLARLKPLVKP